MLTVDVKHQQQLDLLQEYCLHYTWYYVCDFANPEWDNMGDITNVGVCETQEYFHLVCKK